MYAYQVGDKCGRKCGGTYRPQGYSGLGICTYCGASNRYPARHIRRRVIGGKRGRNSGGGGKGNAKVKR